MFLEDFHVVIVIYAFEQSEERWVINILEYTKISLIGGGGGLCDLCKLNAHSVWRVVKWLAYKACVASTGESYPSSTKIQ